MMSMPQNPINQDALRAEILCAIAAGRELGPTMDEHIAASAIERYVKAHPKAPPVGAPAEPHVTPDGVMLRVVAVGLGGGVVAALILAHVWWMAWLVIPILAMLLLIFRTGRARRGRLQGDPAAEREWNERQRYREARHKYEIEKLEAKRAILRSVSEFSKGFSRNFRDR
jgi:hypothetical protein